MRWWSNGTWPEFNLCESGAGMLWTSVRNLLHAVELHENFLWSQLDAIKSMLPTTLPKDYWENSETLKLIDSKRERTRNTRKSFILIPITRCWVTLLCCSFIHFGWISTCVLHAFFMVRRDLKDVFWYWFGFELLWIFPFIVGLPTEQSDWWHHLNKFHCIRKLMRFSGCAELEQRRRGN